MDYPAAPDNARPTITFDQSAMLRVPGGQMISATHAPNAHTDGDIFLHIDRGDVIVCGDLFFNGLFPFIDASSNGSIDGMIAATEQIMKIAGDKTRLVPGHGPLASKKDLVAFHDMLTTVRERLSKLVAQGKTLDEVLAAKPLADLDPIWGQRLFHASHFERIVYPMVSKQS